MAATFIVKHSDIADAAFTKAAVRGFCHKIDEDADAVFFTPEDGSLTRLGLYFTDKGITYRLEFSNHFRF
jgi:hypothetical protein